MQNFIFIVQVGLGPDQWGKALRVKLKSNPSMVQVSHQERKQEKEARLHKNVETRLSDWTRVVSVTGGCRISALEIGCYECRIHDRRLSFSSNARY